MPKQEIFYAVKLGRRLQNNARKVSSPAAWKMATGEEYGHGVEGGGIVEVRFIATSISLKRT